MRAWGLNFIRELCPPQEATDPTLPPAARSASRKTLGLKAAVEKHGFNGLILGIRRDEEAIRAKERFPARRRLVLGSQGPAAGVLEPVHDELPRRHACPGPPAPALD